MKKLPLFEDFVPVGFAPSYANTYSLGGINRPQTGYNMNAIVGPVQELGNHVAEQAHGYESNDNPDHTAESYIKEAKKHINDKIDEACESYSATNEAMVQVAGDKKPSGAKVLAGVIADNLANSKMLKPGVNLNAVKDAIQMMIMENTF